MRALEPAEGTRAADTGGRWLRSGFVWLVPGLWVACSLASFHWPGDEYRLYFIGSIAGSWIFMVLPDVGDVTRFWLRLEVSAAGFVVLAAFGWGMARSGCSGRLWAAIWLGAALCVMAGRLLTYGDLRILQSEALCRTLVSEALFSGLLAFYLAIPLTVLASLFRAEQTGEPL